MIASSNPQCMIGQDQWKKPNKLFLEILHCQHSHVRWVEKAVSLIVAQIGSSDSQTNNWLCIEKLNFLCKRYQNISSYKEIFKDWSSKSGSRPVTETLRRKFNSVFIEGTYYLLIYLSSTLALDQYRAFANNSKWVILSSNFEAIYTGWHLLYDIFCTIGIYLFKEIARMKTKWKYQNNVWDLFSVNKKDSRTSSITSFCLYC